MDPNHAHEFVGNKKNLCKQIIGARYCALPEDAPVHQEAGAELPLRELRIVAAAIQFNNTTWVGTRHANIMQDIWREFPGSRISQEMQGFLSQDGRFWNRFQAGAIAFQAGQTETRKETLLSEHVW